VLHPADWPGRVLRVLRPHPHRGDVIAAGALVLGVAVLMINVRMNAKWDSGVLLVIDALAAALVGGMGLLASLEGPAPRPYHSLLLLVGLALVAASLYRLAQVLGTDHPLSASGTVTWIGLVLVAAAVYSAWWANSAASSLVAGIAGTVTLLSFVKWAFDPSGVSPFRYLLLLVLAATALVAVSWRDRRRRHAVAAVDVSGVAALGLALTFIAVPVAVPAVSLAGRMGAGGPGFGWALVLLSAGCGLIAYAAVDREPGPAYLGVLVLVAAVATIGRPDPSGGSLLGWPIVLALVGAGGVALGLRPRLPLPPAPDAGAPEAPPTPLAPPGGGGDAAEARPPPGRGGAPAGGGVSEETAPIPTPEAQATEPLPEARRSPGDPPTEPLPRETEGESEGEGQ